MKAFLRKCSYESILTIDRRPLGIIKLRRRHIRPSFSLVFAFRKLACTKNIFRHIRISNASSSFYSSGKKSDPGGHNDANRYALLLAYSKQILNDAIKRDLILSVLRHQTEDWLHVARFIRRPYNSINELRADIGRTQNLNIVNIMSLSAAFNQESLSHLSLHQRHLAVSGSGAIKTALALKRERFIQEKPKPTGSSIFINHDAEDGWQNAALLEMPQRPGNSSAAADPLSIKIINSISASGLQNIAIAAADLHNSGQKWHGVISRHFADRNDLNKLQLRPLLKDKFSVLLPQAQSSMAQLSTAQSSIAQSTQAISPKDQSPIAQSSIDKSPYAKSPAVKSSLVKLQQVQSSTAQLSIAQSPHAKSPTAQSSQSQSSHAQSPHAQISPARSSSVKMIYSIPLKFGDRRLKTTLKEDVSSLILHATAPDEAAMIEMKAGQFSQASNQNLILMKRMPANSAVNQTAPIEQMQSGNSRDLALGSARSGGYSQPGHEESPGKETGTESFHELKGINTTRIADSIYPIIVRRIRTDMERRGYCSRA